MNWKDVNNRLVNDLNLVSKQCIAVFEALAELLKDEPVIGSEITEAQLVDALERLGLGFQARDLLTEDRVINSLIELDKDPGLVATYVVESIHQDTGWLSPFDSFQAVLEDFELFEDALRDT